MSPLPTSADLDRIYGLTDIATARSATSITGVSPRETFDLLGATKASTVKSAVALASGFTAGSAPPRWSAPYSSKSIFGLEPEKFDFITSFPGTSSPPGEEDKGTEGLVAVASSSWTFAEKLGAWAQNLPDRETRSVVLNLGGVLISLAGAVASLQVGNTTGEGLALVSLIYAIGALINSIIDKLAS